MLPGRMMGRSWGNVISAQDQSNNGATIPHKGLQGSNYLKGDASVFFMSFSATIEGGSAGNVKGTMWDVLKE